MKGGHIADIARSAQGRTHGQRRTTRTEEVLAGIGDKAKDDIEILLIGMGEIQ